MVAQILREEPQRPRRETDAERHARVQSEAKIIAQAEGEIDAGLGIDDDDMEAWLDELDQDPKAPMPAPRGIASTPRR